MSAYSPLVQVVDEGNDNGYFPSKTRSLSIEVERNGTILSSFPILANTIMGAGILGLPFAVANTGWGLGPLLMFAAACSSSFALHLLSACSLKMIGPASFYSVASRAMPAFAKVVDLAVVIKCFGVATSYLIVIGDLMPDVMSNINAAKAMQTRQIWVVLGFAIVVPLSYMKSLDALKYTSKASICFVAFLTLMMILFACNIANLDPCADHDDDDDCVGTHDSFVVQTSTLKVFSIFIFGFTCHQNVFGIVNELREPSLAKMNWIIVCAVGTAFTISLTIACAGYSAYGSNVESDILVNYPGAPIVSVARIFISLLVCFCYPLQCNPARKCVLTFWSTYDAPDKPADDNTLYFRFLVTTTIFLGMTVAIALSVSDLGVMLSLVGATGSTLVSFILPGFCYYFIFKDDETSPTWKKYAALTQGCVGLIIVPLCLTFIFI